MKRGQPRRDWSAANRKRDAEHNRCRICGRTPAQLAHVGGREHDKNPPLRPPVGWRPYMVAPDRVILLCERCHRRFDRWDLDVLRVMSRWEQAQAVADCGSLVAALDRCCPTFNREGKVPVYASGPFDDGWPW